MDVRVAIAIPKDCAGHISALSRPMLQKHEIGKLVPTLSASKGKKGVNSRQLVVKAASSDEYQFGSGGPNMVDANMILLRKRMFDLKMQETNYKSPEEYMKWEKELYPAYYANVLRAMECLQYSLINTRLIVAIALLSLISVSVSSSVLIISVDSVSRVSEIMVALLSSLHG